MADAICYKRCTTCNENKPVSEYYSHKTGQDGLRPTCKSCGKLATKDYRHTERGKELHRIEGAKYRKTEQGRKVFREGWKRWAKKNPEKNKAVHFLNSELKAGRVQRGTMCYCCCSTTKKLQAHHWRGYDREHWLDVIWVCIPCHKLAH